MTLGLWIMDYSLYASSAAALTMYFDADLVDCPVTRRSSSSYFVFLGANLPFWSSKHQHTISPSSAEEEYRGVANVVVETV